MRKTTFATAQDCEAAFYEALEAGDLEAMMEVWAEDEEVVCVHPGGPRLAGIDFVRESWALIFASGQKLKVHLSHLSEVNGMMLSIRSVHENLSLAGDVASKQTVVTTNVYIRGASGWRMVVHHGSMAPVAPQQQSIRVEDGPKILH